MTYNPSPITDPLVSIIIPTYNERDNIVDLLRQLQTVVPEAGIVVVDDNSPDGTGDEVRRFTRDAAPVELIVRVGERGLGSAYRDGLRYGLENGYEVLITMDADGSHSPLHLPAHCYSSSRAM